jgi:hypothetical protein
VGGKRIFGKGRFSMVVGIVEKDDKVNETGWVLPMSPVQFVTALQWRVPGNKPRMEYKSAQSAFLPWRANRCLVFDKETVPQWLPIAADRS